MNNPASIHQNDGYKFWLMCLVSTARKHFQKVIVNSQSGVFITSVTRGLHVQLIYDFVTPRETETYMAIRARLSRWKGLVGEALLWVPVGRSSSHCPAVLAHLAITGNLEWSCGHKCLMLLYITKPTIFVSPEKEQEEEVEARNLKDNN